MKRFFAFILCFILIVSMFSVNTSAEFGIYKISDALLPSGKFELSEIDDYVLSGSASKYYYSSQAGVEAYTVYSTLDDCQKKIYNAVTSAPVGTLSIKIDFTANEFLRENFNVDYLSYPMYAICLDRPDIFYHRGYSISEAYTNGTHIVSMVYAIPIDSGTTYTADNITEYYGSVMHAVETFPVDLTNRYNFVKSVHDYLCSSAYYPDLNSSDYVVNAHDVYGALVEKRTVCEGYSKAFKLICDYYNIPAVCISGLGNGGPHMWNAVQMDDGLWYLLDITWDDQGNYGTYYDFFLSGVSTVNTYFGGTAFNVSHVPDNIVYIPVLSYAVNKYSQTDHFTSFGATYNNYTDEAQKLLYLSVFDAGKSNIYYNGIYVEVDNYSTGTVISVPSGASATAEEWTLVVLGDVNGDGVCDVNDYAYSVNESISSTGEITEINDFSCDINRDGYIDVLDVSAMALLSSGQNIDLNLE